MIKTGVEERTVRNCMADDLDFEEKLRHAAQDPLRLGEFTAREVHALQQTIARLQLERDEMCDGEKAERDALEVRIKALEDSGSKAMNRGGLIGGGLAGGLLAAVEALRIWVVK